jgi:thymidylate synthase (FAD)
MKIIEPTFEFMNIIDSKQILESIEKAGRVCYKSENKITSNSAKEFIQKILQSGHESVIEHEKITVKSSVIGE